MEESTYKRVKGRSHTVAKRLSMHPHIPQRQNGHTWRGGRARASLGLGLTCTELRERDSPVDERMPQDQLHPDIDVTTPSLRNMSHSYKRVKWTSHSVEE